jgi:hypothetical protein
MAFLRTARFSSTQLCLRAEMVELLPQSFRSRLQSGSLRRRAQIASTTFATAPIRETVSGRIRAGKSTPDFVLTPDICALNRSARRISSVRGMPVQDRSVVHNHRPGRATRKNLGFAVRHWFNDADSLEPAVGTGHESRRSVVGSEVVEHKDEPQHRPSIGISLVIDVQLLCGRMRSLNDGEPAVDEGPPG